MKPMFLSLTQSAAPVPCDASRRALGRQALGLLGAAWPLGYGSWADAREAAPEAAPSAVTRQPDWPLAPPLPSARQQRALDDLAQRIDSEWPDVQSVVVVQGGRLVFEHYRAPLAAVDLQDTQSVTKSVLALLVGCALADGRLRSVDETVASHLPELARLGSEPRLRRLRVAHLLSMTAGWAPDQTARRDRDDDLRQLALRPFVAEPGARFAYDNGSANLLALLLARAVGQPLADYARQRLLAPLGIGQSAWSRAAHGHETGAYGLSLTPRGMARIGELVLADGQWQGRALVPRSFMHAATQPQSAGGAPLYAAYGYLWWLAGRGSGRRSIMANGYGGQWIHIDPQARRVVAATSLRSPESMARAQAMTLIQRQLRPLLEAKL